MFISGLRIQIRDDIVAEEFPANCRALLVVCRYQPITMNHVALMLLYGHVYDSCSNRLCLFLSLVRIGGD